jgi:ferrous iron transport protein B
MLLKLSSAVIALAGNPNVGKSTVFNYLTGSRQHTGNWPGKTVDLAAGSYEYQGRTCTLVDLPGTYSLLAHSSEEEVARDFICSGEADLTLVVCDATCLERNLNLVLQIRALTPWVIVCVNLCDEAAKKGISVDFDELSRQLMLPVVGASAAKGEGMSALQAAIEAMSRQKETVQNPEEVCHSQSLSEGAVSGLILQAERIAHASVSFQNPEYDKRDRRIDRIVTSRTWGIPIMLGLLLVVFWITLVGANYPSSLLSRFFGLGYDRLVGLAASLHAPVWLSGLLIDGVYQVLTWVIAVMLPPMAIFFPLFTLLEDFGYLPRIAFNLDHCFKKCSACGKQALTMCMGFGCNAVGVTGCRIIDSERERLIAMLTNAFVPCNGRFPSLLTVISLFFLAGSAGLTGSFLSALILTLVIALGVAMTLAMSRFLSRTLLKGKPSAFTLELPPYRKPQVGKIIVRSLWDRTLFVLGRAVLVAAPAGLIIWLLANLTMPGGSSLLLILAGWLDPLGRLMGLDGVILMAFLLGFPANEIVLPIALMAYLQTGTLVNADSLAGLASILTVNGWTWTTAVSFLLFCLMHWPCSTTCLTIRKETGSWRYTGLAVLLPTACGMILCIAVTFLFRVFGLA